MINYFINLNGECTKRDRLIRLRWFGNVIRREKSETEHFWK